MNSDADDMSSFLYYYDKEKKSSSEDEHSDDVNMTRGGRVIEEEIDSDLNEPENENDFDDYFNFEPSNLPKRRMELERRSSSPNYPKLRHDSDDEEGEFEEEWGSRRRIPRYPRIPNNDYVLGYGSPPEEEVSDYRSGQSQSSGYSSGGYNRDDYTGTYGNYRNYNSFDADDNSRDIDNVSNRDIDNDSDNFKFKFRDMPNIKTRTYYNRYSGLSGYSESSLSGPSTPEPIRGKLSREEGGRVGLRNLGNTCYLNSTLQCLTATHELSYRLAEDFENGTLPSGKFLTAMARLFHEMWQAEGKASSISRSVMPTQFKSVLGQVDSRFSGYRQEDSQEALAIILDRLHEELKKEVGVDVDKLDDTSVDGWEKYCKKENSLVRELFHGQLKSTLECSKCSFKSETFEPFCFLNLPIPVNEPREPSDNKSICNKHDNKSICNKHDNKHDNQHFNICCFNDKIYNAESAYLIMNRRFKNVNEFRLFFKDAAVWIVEVEGNRMTGVRTKLPSLQELSTSRHAFIAFKAEILFKNHLITFVAARTGEVVGFPMLLRTQLNETLTPALFIESFLKGTIRSIYVYRYPERLKSFDSTISLMLASANEYFKVEYIENSESRDLYHVRVVILNDKSDFNEMIFFKEIGDPTDLFDELCIDLVDNTSDSEPESAKVTSESISSIGHYNHSDNPYSAYSGNSTHNSNQISPYGSYNSHISHISPHGSYNNHVSHVSPYSYTPYRASPVIDNSPVSLKECFDKLFSSETFNEWKCEKCGIPVDAEKRLELWRLPEILILHLKRFSYGGVNSGFGFGGYATGGGAKLSKAVDFPLQLDTNCDGSVVYELFGISQHFGSLNFGHYTAILKHQSTGEWFLADDGSITVYESESDWYNAKVKESAYVLFYRRINK